MADQGDIMQNMDDNRDRADRTGESEWFGSAVSAVLNALICTPLIYGAYINIGTGHYIAVAVCATVAAGTAYLGIMDIIDIVDEIKGAREADERRPEGRNDSTQDS